MKIRRCLGPALVAGACVWVGLSCSPPTPQGAAPGADNRPLLPVSAGGASSAVATALSGKLVKLVNGAVVAAAIEGDPQYFVFYHSASW